MSGIRSVFSDGQGLTTPDFQRMADNAASEDDRVYEVLMTPTARRVVPLSDESVALNPRLLAIPSSAGLTPAGTNGAVRVLPHFVEVGAANSQQMALSGTSYSVLDTAAIASNGGGSIRYDLVYAQVTRAVNATGSRRIKSVNDGTVAGQTINLSDVPTISVSIIQGFLTGATAPTTAQINAAVPADIAASGSSPAVYYYPLAYVQVANGYTSGTTLFQSAAGGTTFLVQAFTSGFVVPHRVLGVKPGTIYSGVASEKPVTALQVSGNFGAKLQYIAHFKNLSGTNTSISGGVVLDASVDWRNRLVWGQISYLSSGTNQTLETVSSVLPGAGTSNTNTAFGPFYTGNGSTLTVPNWSISYTVSTTSVVNFGVSSVDGSLRFCHTGAPQDGTNGDLLAIVINASDRFQF